MPSRIQRIDMKPFLTRANEKGGVEGRAIMERIRLRVQDMISNGKHVHLHADDIEECLYPDAQCWQGVRDNLSSRVYRP